MNVLTCARCGQPLLPEILRELGDGRHCPFCNANLPVQAPRATSSFAAPSKPVSPPPANAPQRVSARLALASKPIDRGSPPPRASSAPGASLGPAPPAARPPSVPVSRTIVSASGAPAGMASAALAVAVPPPTREPDTARNPVLALAHTPAPETALGPPPAPPSLLSSGSVNWSTALRRRPWLVAPPALLLIVTMALLARRPPVAAPAGSVAPGKAVPRPAAAAQTEPAPGPARTVAVAEPPRPGPLAQHAELSSDRPPATGGHAVRRRSKGQRSAHRHKEHASRSSRGKHQRTMAAKTAGAPKSRGDEPSARAAYEKGNRLLLTGDTPGAVAAYRESVQLAPASPAGYRGLGLAYEKQGRNGEAERAFHRYLKLAPDSGNRDLVAQRLQHLRRLAGGAAN